MRVLAPFRRFASAQSAGGIVLLAATAIALGWANSPWADPWTYGVIGLALWATVLVSGIHATVAGVSLVFAIPVRTRVNEHEFLTEARRALADFDAAAAVTAAEPATTVLANAGHHAALEEIETVCEHAQPPLIRMEHALHGVVSFGIMPLFALANAGVAIDASALGSALASPVTVGAALGLLIGKPLGIAGFSRLAVRLGVSALPKARPGWPSWVWRSSAASGSRYRSSSPGWRSRPTPRAPSSSTPRSSASSPRRRPRGSMGVSSCGGGFAARRVVKPLVACERVTVLDGGRLSVPAGV